MTRFIHLKANVLNGGARYMSAVRGGPSREDADTTSMSISRMIAGIGKLPTIMTIGLIAGLSAWGPARAYDDVINEDQITISPHHPIRGNLSGFGELGYHWSAEDNYSASTIMWGVIETPARWAQLSAGLRVLATDDAGAANKLEYRPFVGAKLFLENDLKWNLYNYTRFEYRDVQNRATREWSGFGQLRSRFGVEIPLTTRAKAWEPRTWYGLVDVEPYYRFDDNTVITLVTRAGIARILKDSIHLEAIYYRESTRPPGSSSLEYTENIFRLNVKIGLKEGLLRRLLNPGHGD